MTAQRGPHCITNNSHHFEQQLELVCSICSAGSYQDIWYRWLSHLIVLKVKHKYTQQYRCFKSYTISPHPRLILYYVSNIQVFLRSSIISSCSLIPFSFHPPADYSHFHPIQYTSTSLSIFSCSWSLPNTKPQTSVSVVSIYQNEAMSLFPD